jgi:nitrate reductase gamma subunit
MRYPPLHLARPLYEGLPWLYMACGLAALVASYREVWPRASVFLGLTGAIALLAGVVVWLRRRDYRRMRTHYARPDALSESDEERGE